MKLLLIFVGTFFCFSVTNAQIRNRGITVPVLFQPSVISSTNTSVLRSFYEADPPKHHRLSVPILMQRGANANIADGYWTGSITTQSMNKGKMGTYYYWDIQGNLLESRFFLDINRKNKYAFKLVIPRL
jgi:hypothetical protein